jgi:hypothetical protein
MHIPGPGFRAPAPGRGCTRDIHEGTSAMPQSQSTEQFDFNQFTDPDFLAERGRVRDELERAPEQSATRVLLAARYDAMNAEFDRRASQAWTGAS